ncbi:helix-turn-helix transcriptional regulator (plasmid) [Spirosoma sp. SC4-14]|uniref:helix-turn-helix domain-containing protein n=1 Tax=Spirosoma sp. SC4-14 TaxID=3128900 RepID=UPI0030CCFF38
MGKASLISTAFGKAVKQERLKKGWTQDDLAEHCRLDRSYISRIERGLKNPTLSVAWDIATQLNISMLSLIALTVEKLPIDYKNVERPN